jgi:hypothetical protein
MEKKPDRCKVKFKDCHGNTFNGNYSKDTDSFYAYGFSEPIKGIVEWSYQDQPTQGIGWVKASEVIRDEYKLIYCARELVCGIYIYYSVVWLDSESRWIGRDMSARLTVPGEGFEILDGK